MTILKLNQLKKLVESSTNRELSQMEMKDVQDTWAVFEIEMCYIADILKRAGLVESSTQEDKS